MRRVETTRFASALLALLAAAPLAAQVPNPSPASVGMANTYTAMARGFSSMRWNPAGLGMPDSPETSITLMAVRAIGGLDPVSPGDIAEYQDSTTVPASVRQDWLDRIVDEGAEQGNAGGGLTFMAINVSRVGIQVGTNVVATADVLPAAAELLLFGNAGRTGSAEDLEPKGSNFDIGIVSSAAVSYAQPLSLSLGPLPDQHFSVGATVKYIVGHALISGENFGSRSSADPLEIQLDFPVIQSIKPDTLYDGTRPKQQSDIDKGHGWGLDLGVMWQGGIFSAGVSVQNVVNTFEWNEDDMWYRPGQALFNADTSTSDFGARPLSEAPQALRDRLDDLRFKPVIAVAGAVQLPMVKVSAEVRRRTAKSLSLDADNHIGVGAEFRPVSFLPLRAGLAKVEGGFNLGAGFGLELGGFNVNFGGNRRTSDLGTDWVGAFGISLGG